MTIEKYIKQLQKVAERHPGLKVVYARDDEGNGYQEVCFTPSAGLFKDGDFTKELDEGEKFNAICVN